MFDDIVKAGAEYFKYQSMNLLMRTVWEECLPLVSLALQDPKMCSQSFESNMTHNFKIATVDHQKCSCLTLHSTILHCTF